MESITILPDKAVSLTKSPYLKPYYDKTGYNYIVMVTDNSKDSINHEPFLTNDTGNPNFVAPIVRVWAKGYLDQLPIPSPTDYGVKLKQSDDNCNGSFDWWKVLTINGFTASILTQTPTYNICGSVDPTNGDYDFFPYLLK
jgi:hypothetical protein